MYAIIVSGLSHTMDKLRAQSDIVITDMYDACHLITVVCICDITTTITEMTLPLNFIVTQVASVVYHNTAVELYA